MPTLPLGSLFLCLYSKMFRMREAYNGTHKGMDEVYLGVSVFMCDVCVLVGGGGGG